MSSCRLLDLEPLQHGLHSIAERTISNYYYYYYYYYD